MSGRAATASGPTTNAARSRATRLSERFDSAPGSTVASASPTTQPRRLPDPDADADREIENVFPLGPTCAELHGDEADLTPVDRLHDTHLARGFGDLAAVGGKPARSPPWAMTIQFQQSSAKAIAQRAAIALRPSSKLSPLASSTMAPLSTSLTRLDDVGWTTAAAQIHPDSSTSHALPTMRPSGSSMRRQDCDHTRVHLTPDGDHARGQLTRLLGVFMERARPDLPVEDEPLDALGQLAPDMIEAQMSRIDSTISPSRSAWGRLSARRFSRSGR